jgi:hypothetical protein
MISSLCSWWHCQIALSPNGIYSHDSLLISLCSLPHKYSQKARRFIVRTPTLQASARVLRTRRSPASPVFLHLNLIPVRSSSPELNRSITPLCEKMADLPHTSRATQPAPQSIPSSTSEPIVLTADALQVLLTHVARNFPTGASVQTIASPTTVPVTVAQENLPPFHSTTATVVAPGQTLYDLFPLIETSTILAITMHIFKPLDLFKLAPMRHDKNVDLKTVLDFDNGTISVKAHSGSLQDYYPHFTTLVEPLTIYFDILSAYAASSGNAAATYAIVTGGFHYIRHLSTLNRSYHWGAVLQYHKAFFMLRCREMLRGDYTGWARSDGQLMNCHLYHQVRSSAVDSFKPPQVTSSSSSSSSTPVSSQVCYSFNTGAYTTSSNPSGDIHKCQKCDAVAMVLRNLRRQLRSMAG